MTTPMPQGARESEEMPVERAVDRLRVYSTDTSRGLRAEEARICVAEIERLREFEWMYKELCK